MSVTLLRVSLFLKRVRFMTDLILKIIQFVTVFNTCNAAVKVLMIEIKLKNFKKETKFHIIEIGSILHVYNYINNSNRLLS